MTWSTWQDTAVTIADGTGRIKAYRARIKLLIIKTIKQDSSGPGPLMGRVFHQLVFLDSFSEGGAGYA